MTEEQLLQEARLEAENLYPYEGDIDYNYIESVREKFIQCYIQQSEKRKSEAAAFSLWQTTRQGVDARTDLIYDSPKRGLSFHEELFQIFKQQQQKQE